MEFNDAEYQKINFKYFQYKTNKKFVKLLL